MRTSIRHSRIALSCRVCGRQRTYAGPSLVIEMKSGRRPIHPLNLRMTILVLRKLTSSTASYLGEVLGIDEYASQEEVKKAYKKLSLVYHPDKTAGMGADQKEEYAAIFIELKNAYLTLSDNPTRRQYDRERDRDKASFEVSGFKPKTRAHFDASEVLKKLQEMQKPPGKHIDIPMAVKLEKFFYGGHKGIRRERRVKDFGGFNQETRIYRVDIPRAATEPHEVTFRSGGDHHEDTRPDTLCFKMSSKPHAVVERRGEDLVLRSRVGLGTRAQDDPYLWAETPTVGGRHLLLWGGNPFYHTSAASGEMKVQVKGEGLTPSASLHMVCRLGLAATTSSPVAAPFRPAARGSADQVLLTIKHMQTDGKIFIRIHKTATIGEVRSKIIEVLDLPRNATVRMLQHFSGGYTPFSERQQLGALRSLNCAGTAWNGVNLTPARCKQFLQDVIRASEQPDAQVGDLYAQIVSVLVNVLPEYGLEPGLSVMKDALDLIQVEGLPGMEHLVEKINSLQSMTKTQAGKHVNGAQKTLPGEINGSQRSGIQSFLLMHNLGPPGGFAKADQQTANEAPAMLRRLARRQQWDASCRVTLEPWGEPMTLFTKPTCKVTFYTNLHQPRSAGCVVEPIFAVSICSPPCAKKKAASEWRNLKDSLVPLLKLTAFHVFKAIRRILPMSLANAPAAVSGDCSEATAMPWKVLADEAFHEKNYFMAGSFYTRWMEEHLDDEPSVQAAVLSNRAACWAKVGHFEASKEDAQKALELRPDWGRAWSRIGLACAKLGQGKDAVEAYKKAVSFDPSSANVEALASVVKQAKLRVLRAPNIDLAHAEKENGNTALRGHELGLAVACYTTGLALLPPEAVAAVPDGVAPEDEHALLRSVLFSNRASVFCRLKTWRSARADAQAAVEKKGDFVKARNRLGTALLACGQVEQAYVHFAHALKLESNNTAALKGRQACISILPLWRTLPARRRFRERFGVDLWRPKGTSKVYAISDMHFDHKCNEDWAHRIDDFQFQED
ncbi:unnamed protein product, partial [Durusdinium trenchii]